MSIRFLVVLPLLVLAGTPSRSAGLAQSHSHRDPAPVHGHHVPVDGLVVRRAQPTARARAATGSDPHVVLVEVLGPIAALSGQSDRPSMRSQLPTKSGSVLAVVATFSTSTPGTSRPSRAPVVAIRWSS